MQSFVLPIKMAGVENFAKSPSVDFVERCTKEQLLKLDEYYNKNVPDKRLKGNINCNCVGKFV